MQLPTLAPFMRMDLLSDLLLKMQEVLFLGRCSRMSTLLLDSFHTMLSWTLYLGLCTKGSGLTAWAMGQEAGMLQVVCCFVR